jgi:rifampicin phosphotransferase
LEPSVLSTTSDLRFFADIGSDDVDIVGGKGLSLALLTRAGLPVPAGFCVTSAAFRRARGQRLADLPDLVSAIADAYRELGGGLVAVRSSATAEDGAITSFAGQQETILGVEGTEAVCDAVARCWASLDSDRAVAYRRRQGIADDGLAMAVVVQRLVAAEVAGVLFTRDPLDPDGRRMLVEASWGLGEAVVSGRVTPDRYALARDDGSVVERQIHAKTVEVTAAGVRSVPTERQLLACMDAARLAQLAELGRQVEIYYGAPRDIEWAWAEGRLWLLQARPITTADAVERERVRREEIAALVRRAEVTGTVWSRFNLSESLPEPTPMTWALVRRLLSGRGGAGLMLRDLGFDPDPALDDEGVFDLVCGRPYCNLSREARQHSRLLPYEHSFQALKRAPQRALYPRPGLNPARAGWTFWLGLPVLLPVAIYRLVRAMGLQHQARQTFPPQFRTTVLPAFDTACTAALASDLSTRNTSDLPELLEQWSQIVLVDFGREALKPTALAAAVLTGLENQLLPTKGPEGAAAAARALLMGARAEPDSDLPGALSELAAGRLDRATFLAQFGHRGSHEMELSQPRWSEDQAALERLAGGRPGSGHAASDAWHAAWNHLVAIAGWGATQQARIRAEVATLHVLLGLRETAKHYLMKGFAVLRRILLELDRRYRLQGGVFFLTPEELPRLVAGEDLTSVIAERKRRRTLVLGLEVPPVLFSDDLEAIGRPPAPPDGADLLRGVPLSAGVAEAPALVLEEPLTGERPAGPYVLVCPSTDPAWVPLFDGARALVMETGGVLSHGAIVAREYGLPAVAGLDGITRRLRTGQRLRVDGGGGTVTILPE